MDRSPARPAGSSPSSIEAATGTARTGAEATSGAVNGDTSGLGAPGTLPGLDALVAPALLVAADGRIVGVNAAARSALDHELLSLPVTAWPDHRTITGEDGRPLRAADLPFGPGALAGSTGPNARPSERLLAIAAADGRIHWFTAWAQPWTGEQMPGASTPVALTILFPGDARRRITEAGRERVAELDRRYGRQAALARAGLAVNQPRELPTLLGTLLDRLRSDLPANAAAIALRADMAGVTAVPAADDSNRAEHDGDPGDAFASDRAPAGDGPASPDHVGDVSPPPVFASDAGFTGPAERAAAEALHVGGAGQWVARAGRPLTVDRPATDPYRTDPNSPIHSWAAVPLTDGGEVFGVLYAFDRGARRFDADDLLFLRELARRAAAAIAKVRLIDRLEHQRTELALHRDHLEELVSDRTAELEASHARLRTADRLAAIGTFTAGLGHDMNNVLFPLRCRLDALEQQPEIDLVEASDAIAATRRAVTFLQSLSDGLRLFARDPLATDPDASTPLDTWWTSVAPLLRHSVPNEVAVEAALPTDLPPVNVAAAGLTQVVLNLMVNAADVMPDGGHVRISARRPDDEVAREDTVILEVADDGPGMAADVAAQVFDPFFSTKTRTVSTGLGLWLVHQVVDRAGGAVELDTAPGRGTRFELHLPIAPGNAADSGRSPAGSRVTAGPEDASDSGGSTAPATPAARLRVAIESPDPRRAAWIGRAVEDAGADLAGTAGASDGDETAPEVVILVAGPDDGSGETGHDRISTVRARAPRAQLLLVGAWPEPASAAPASDDAAPLGRVVDPDDLPSIRELLQRIIDGRPPADRPRPAQEGP